MSNNDRFIDQMDKANGLAKSQGYDNAIAWAREAYDYQKITQFDFKKFESLHKLRNLLAHGSACDIQISEDTLMAAYAFTDAVSGSGITGFAYQGSYLRKDENLNRKRTYAKKGDFVLIYNSDDSAYEIYVWGEVHGRNAFVPVSKYTYSDLVQDANGSWYRDYALKECDYKYELNTEHPAFVVPTLPDEIVLRTRPYILEVMLSAGELGGYQYGKVTLNFGSGLQRGRSIDTVTEEFEGYVALPECFRAERPLAFEDVEECLEGINYCDLKRQVLKKIESDKSFKKDGIFDF